MRSGVTPGAAEQPVRLAALAAREREQQVLGGDVLVLEPRHLVEGGHQHLAQRVADGRLAAAELLGAGVELALQPRRQRLRGHLEALQQATAPARPPGAAGRAAGARARPGRAAARRRLLGGLQGLLGAFGEAVKAHGGVIPARDADESTGDPARRVTGAARSWRTMRLVAMPFVLRRPSILAVLVVVATICALAVVSGRAGPAAAVRARAATSTAADLARAGLVRHEAARPTPVHFVGGGHAARRPGDHRARRHPRRHRLQHHPLAAGRARPAAAGEHRQGAHRAGGAGEPRPVAAGDGHARRRPPRPGTRPAWAWPPARR